MPDHDDLTKITQEADMLGLHDDHDDNDEDDDDYDDSEFHSTLPYSNSTAAS